MIPIPIYGSGRASRAAHHLVLHGRALLQIPLADAELLDLLELVDPEDTPRVLPVGARLLTEAGRHASIPAEMERRPGNINSPVVHPAINQSHANEQVTSSSHGYWTPVTEKMHLYDFSLLTQQGRHASVLPAQKERRPGKISLSCVVHPGINQSRAIITRTFSTAAVVC